MKTERMTGIEPAPSVWKTEALPLSYIRSLHQSINNRGAHIILCDRLAEVVLVRSQE